MPENIPQESQCSEAVKHGRPTPGRDDDGCEEERRHSSQGNPTGIESNRPGALLLWYPMGKQIVNRWKRDAFANSHTHTSNEQARERDKRSGWSEKRKHRPPEHAESQHDLAAIAIGQPSP